MLDRSALPSSRLVASMMIARSEVITVFVCARTILNLLSGGRIGGS